MICEECHGDYLMGQAPSQAEDGTIVLVKKPM